MKDIRVKRSGRSGGGGHDCQEGLMLTDSLHGSSLHKPGCYGPLRSDKALQPNR